LPALSLHYTAQIRAISNATFVFAPKAANASSMAIEFFYSAKGRFEGADIRATARRAHRQPRQPHNHKQNQRRVTAMLACRQARLILGRRTKDAA
jgi:hypothetical protein